MLLRIDDFVHFDDVGVRALRPYLHFVVNIFKIICDFHLSRLWVLACSLLLEEGLVHHFHGEVFFNVCLVGFRVCPLSKHFFHFWERAFANVVENFELVYVFIILQKWEQYLNLRFQFIFWPRRWNKHFFHMCLGFRTSSQFSGTGPYDLGVIGLQALRLLIHLPF